MVSKTFLAAAALLAALILYSSVRGSRRQAPKYTHEAADVAAEGEKWRQRYEHEALLLRDTRDELERARAQLGRMRASAAAAPQKALPAAAAALTEATTAASAFEPLCQVQTFGAKVCERGGAVAPCRQWSKTGATPGATGAWTLEESYTYFLDKGLARALAALFGRGSVLEFGAGKGCYVAALRRAGYTSLRAYDGAPGVERLTGGLVQRADLTARLSFGPSDWVLCLEVAEHIPRAHEEAFVQNLHAHNRRGIVLSWSNNEGGNGHVNLRTVEWVAARFGALGYDHDAAATKALRDAVKDIAWLRDTILVLRRRAQ